MSRPDPRPGRRRGRGRPETPVPWTRPEGRPRRGRVPLDHADIVGAALDVADEEGLDAVSMRRVAQELGVGAMTLYSYVESKDELIELMGDEIMAEMLVPELPADWREALRAIGRRTRVALLHHPWVVGASGRGAARSDRIGPNAMRHFEQSVAAVSGLGLDRAGMFELISAVDDFVIGSVAREIEFARNPRERGFESDPETRFERGLEWLLAGMARDVNDER
jgi:AcrR family transcriptional regulator